MTDESPIGIILWFVLFVVVNLEWIAIDLWLKAHHHEYLTTEYREALHSWVWGTVVVGLTIATVAVFVAHMYFFHGGGD